MNSPSNRRGREVKLAPLDFKGVRADGVFEGYASLFNRPDMSGDVVRPGAFSESLAKRGAAGVRLLFQHDPAEPVGVWEELREDRRGLFVRGRLVTDIRRGRELLLLMQAGALEGLSIGFRTQQARRDRRVGRRYLHKIDLWEISLVTFPMQPGARVSRVKSANRSPFVRSIPHLDPPPSRGRR